ncbi:MAG: uroporphyrinogen decarboxylase family protein [Candidatus Korobacteraceae bacterium]
MPDDMNKLFDERLGRYQAAIALEPTDRIPIATGTNVYAEIYSGNTKQETLYNPEKWLQAELAFARDFPEFDVLRNNRIYGPLYDAIDLKSYQLSGRDVGPNTDFQFMEAEYMLADEYDALIANPVKFMFDCFLPRILGEFKERGSIRSYMAFLKAGMAQAQWGQIMRNRTTVLQQQAGMPQPMGGAFLAPFDALADVLRGLRGSLLDCRRQPDKVLAACEALVPVQINFALVTADPLKRWPVFVPTHKACFMSPKQFDTFYWPSFKKVLEGVIAAGHTVRAYLEGDWAPHWHHMLELPKGKVLCDIDNQGDIFRAKKDIGHHQCIAGGVKNTQLILGTPEEVRQQVKLLCETVGQGGGFIISGGCNIGYETKAENLRALADAIMEFGWYDKSVKAMPKAAPAGRVDAAYPLMVTPWDSKKAEIGGVQGDEDLIRRPWESLESAAYIWLWQWLN